MAASVLWRCGRQSIGGILTLTQPRWARRGSRNLPLPVFPSSFLCHTLCFRLLFCFPPLQLLFFLLPSLGLHTFFLLPADLLPFLGGPVGVVVSHQKLVLSV